jgi:Tetratricopeptide repeat.
LAQSAVAQLQLNHKHDKKEYIQCYLNLVKIRGTPTSYFNLGVAYAQINCLEDTKHAFSYALEMDPRNEELVVKIGDFYTDTSQIDNALNVFISYDKQAPDNLKIKIKLANLYCMKGQPDLAKINLEMVQNLSDNEDANHTKQLYFFLKLAEIYCSINDWEMSAENLVKGLKIQRK